MEPPNITMQPTNQSVITFTYADLPWTLEPFALQLTALGRPCACAAEAESREAAELMSLPQRELINESQAS